MSTLIGTKVKDAEVWLPRFISEVEALTGDIEKIAVMYGESQDNSLNYLKYWQKSSQHEVKIYADPYLPPTERHGAFLTRIKEDIQKILEKSDAEYYLNIDCDLVSMARDTIPNLKSHDKDLIAGMVWTEGRAMRTFFDSFIFRTEEHRFHPYDPPTNNYEGPFQVDSVSTYYLAKKEVELAGKYSNPYPHIPFCADLKEKGYTIWVDPNTHSYHIDLEAIGIRHEPLPHPYSSANFIDSKGQKWLPFQIGAYGYHMDLLEYTSMLSKTEVPSVRSFVDSRNWWSTRPLITACYKVYNSAEFLIPSLGSIYDYVDEIIIVEGAVKMRRHEGKHSTDDTLKLIQDFINFIDYDANKITLISDIFESKEHIQKVLRDYCTSKWMFFIDDDEVYTEAAMKTIRKFCEANQKGEYIYARPQRFLNFWCDFKHVAVSMNPQSPFGEYQVPHPMLIWRDIPGLNFGGFHTMPMDGFGRNFTMDDRAYPSKTATLDSVMVYHFGNAKRKSDLKAKQEYYHARGDKQVFEDYLFSGELPVDMILSEWKSGLPEAMKDHPRLEERLIKITSTKPLYKFKWLKK